MKDAIIVADDSAIIKNIVEKAFEGEELDILKASNGREAINIITGDKEHKILAMLLDLNMPEYDGFMVLNYFKNNNLFKRIPISIISGDDTKETMQKAFDYDIVDMLCKPFSKENIKGVVNRTISTREEDNRKVL